MWKKNWLWVVLSIIFALGYLTLYKTNPAEAVEKSAQMGTIVLLLVLLPKNLTMWLPQTFVLQSFFRKCVVWRRDLGIVSGVLFVLHSFGALWLYGQFDLSLLLEKTILPGTVSLIIFTALLATSSSLSMRVLKQSWSVVQHLVWVAVPLVFMHSIIATSDYNGEYSKIGVLGFGGLVVFVFVETWFFITHKDKVIPARWRHISLVILGSILALAIFFFYPNRQ